jgi:hypothetical protein
VDGLGAGGRHEVVVWMTLCRVSQVHGLKEDGDDSGVERTV